MRLPPLAALFLGAALSVAVLAGCTPSNWEPRVAPAALGSPGSGFLPSAPPTPEATLSPAVGSWDSVHPSPDYRVVLLSAGDDAPTRTLAAVVDAWAVEEGIQLRTVDASEDHVEGIVRAMELNPDLIISVGNDLVDALATVSPNHLDRHFLVLGAEIAEPTGNVTAVDWTGASFRGAGVGASSTYDPATFTVERCGAAVRAGVAAVLTDLTGVVLWID